MTAVVPLAEFPTLWSGPSHLLKVGLRDGDVAVLVLTGFVPKSTE